MKVDQVWTMLDTFGHGFWRRRIAHGLQHPTATGLGDGWRWGQFKHVQLMRSYIYIYLVMPRWFNLDRT